MIVALVLLMHGLDRVAAEALPGGLVHLRDVDSSIAQDIRYAGHDNFTGRSLPGYEAAECILTREAALALKAVQAELAGSGFALKVYDCYRPARAVRAMVAWVRTYEEDGASKRFFPRFERRNLLAGYISASSKHSTGAAVDATLVARERAVPAAFDPRERYGPCNGPSARRSPDDGVDMGTGFDCFDVDSRTASLTITSQQRRLRRLLVEAMGKHGFRNYHREWWHFVHAPSARAVRYDFPICQAQPARVPSFPRQRDSRDCKR